MIQYTCLLYNEMYTTENREMFLIDFFFNHRVVS